MISRSHPPRTYSCHPARGAALARPTAQNLAAGAFLVMAALILFATSAHAQTPDGLSAITQNVAANAGPIPRLIALICYILGVFFTAAGLLKLKDWINDNERNKLTPALMRLVVAIFLILLPHALVLTVTALFPVQADGTYTAQADQQLKAQSFGAFKRLN